METQNLQAIAIIPARYGSTRLKGKPLVDICGKPLIQRVWEAASKSRILKRIVIATDDTRIADECFNFGAEYILTTSNLPSGTDRILSAYIELKEDAEFIVNIQGDEPLLTSQIIDDLIIKFIPSKADVGTLVRKIETFEELSNSSNVKVVLKKGNLALSFSRNIIPYLRDVETNDWL